MLKRLQLKLNIYIYIACPAILIMPSNIASTLVNIHEQTTSDDFIEVGGLKLNPEFTFQCSLLMIDNFLMLSTSL